MRREYYLHMAKKKIDKLEKNITDDWYIKKNYLNFKF
jgi:hypothetical protein